MGIPRSYYSYDKEDTRFLCVRMWGDSTGMHSLRKQEAKAFLHCPKWFWWVDLLDTEWFPTGHSMKDKGLWTVSRKKSKYIWWGKKMFFSPLPSSYLTSSIHSTEASLWWTLQTAMPSSTVFLLLLRLSDCIFERLSQEVQTAHEHTTCHVWHGKGSVSNCPDPGDSKGYIACWHDNHLHLSTAWCSQKEITWHISQNMTGRWLSDTWLYLAWQVESQSSESAW